MFDVGEAVNQAWATLSRSVELSRHLMEINPEFEIHGMKVNIIDDDQTGETERIKKLSLWR